MRKVTILAVCVTALGAQPPSLEEISLAVQSVAERAEAAVVQVMTRGFHAGEGEGGSVQSRQASGSGVIVHPDGYVLTNVHVVGGARRVMVLVPQSRGNKKLTGKLMPAEVMGTDRETDLAVLKIDVKGAAHLQFADSDALRQGQLVLALGSPFGLTNSISMGVISSVAREVRLGDPMVYIQTDASINPGNSGGALVDARGQLIGINTFIVTGSGGSDGVGFAAPSNIARAVYEQIREHGRVKRGQIGILPQTITPELAQALALPRDSGVLLGDVTPRSAAEAAGLAVRDIVLSINGKPVETGRQLGAEIYRHAGDTISIEVLRDGRQLPLRVEVMERPRDPDRILTLLTGPNNRVAKLGILAVDLDERVTPLLPALRKLSGVVVAGTLSTLAATEDALRAGDVIYAVNNRSVRGVEELRTAVQDMPHGQPVALQIERLSQVQFLVLEID